MKPIRYIIWGILFLFFIIHLVIVLAHSTALIQQHLAPEFISAGFGILLVLTAVLLVLGIKKGDFKRTPSYIILCVAFSFLIGTGLFWMVTDGPAVENNYSENNVINKPNGSFSLLDIFNKADIQVLEEESKRISTDNKKVVDEVWKGIEKFRNAINELDQFDTICDLPEGTELNIEVPFLKFNALREIAKIHGRYFLLHLSGDDTQEVVSQFCRFYRVARKGMEDSTLVIHKMMFANLVEKAMETTWSALKTGNIDPDTLGFLQENFMPSGFTEISLTRPIISEYLIMKNTMLNLITPKNMLDSIRYSPDRDEREEYGNPLLSSVLYHLGFKPNQSLEDMTMYYDLLIKATSQYPVDTTEAEAYQEEYSRKPQIKNMIGWILNSIAMPDPKNMIGRMEIIKVKSDLLAFAIHERFGQTLEIDDFYTEQPLTFKMDGSLLKHPGKDGKYETEDDIALGEKEASF